MPIVDHEKREVGFKIVYWGSGLTGKTTNQNEVPGTSSGHIFRAAPGVVPGHDRARGAVCEARMLRRVCTILRGGERGDACSQW